MLGCLGNVRPYMLETILFLIFRLSDFKDMSNLKIESIHLKLSRSVSRQAEKGKNIQNSTRSNT